MYLLLINIFLSFLSVFTSHNVRENLNSTISGSYFFLNENLDLDTVDINNLLPHRVVVGEYSCSKCLNILSIKFEEVGISHIDIISYSLSRDFDKNEVLDRYLSVRSAINREFRGAKVDYKIYFTYSSGTTKKSPYVITRCGTSEVILDYDYLFSENNGKIKACKN